jgi:nucleotide-binding universal stress UspA family protein
MTEQTTPQSPQEPGTTAPLEVVVGSDGSWHSRPALARAALEAQARGLPLTVLTVVSTVVDSRLTFAAQRDAQTERVESAQTSAAEAAQQLRALDPDLSVRTIVLLDNQVDELREVLHRCGLLVVGDAGATGHRAFLVGSTSRDLVRGVTCPVLVLPESDDGARSAGLDARSGLINGAVLVGVDGTDADTAVLQAAALEAERLGKQIVVLHSCARDRASGREAAEAAGDDRVRRSLEAAQLPPQIQVSTVLTADPPGQALLAHSASAALVVVGSRGPLALARLAVGSVSRELLDSSSTPVLVVPKARQTSSV